MIRRVVTDHDAGGRAVFSLDGTPPRTVEAPTGHAVSDVLWLGGPPRTAADGGEAPEGPFVLEPPPGGLSCRVIRLPPPPADASADERWLRVAGDDATRPGMHATDTLDFMAVLDGEIVLGLDDGDHRLGAGDVVAQRGTAHRWRVAGDRPCTYAVTMLRSDPSAPEPSVALTPRATGSATGAGPRRLVTADDDARRSYLLSDGEAPVVYQPAGPGEVTLVDLWQTGGRVRRPDQGGDTETWALEPLGAGVAFRFVELPAGHDPGERGWHTTATIDVEWMLSGHIELALPDLDPVVLGPGDVVVQRGTCHKWRVVGHEPVRYFALMVGLTG